MVHTPRIESRQKCRLRACVAEKCDGIARMRCAFRPVGFREIARRNSSHGSSPQVRLGNGKHLCRHAFNAARTGDDAKAVRVGCCKG